MTSSLAMLDSNFAIPGVTKPVEWYDMAELPTQGQGWPGQTPGRFGRLPAKAKGVVRDAVWELGECSAGLAVRFVTSSPLIATSWDIVAPALAMNHMPATGVSGLDLYVRSQGRWKWASVTRPEGKGARTFTQMMLDNIDPIEREYLLYLPLYNSVSGVRIGIAPGHALAAATRPQTGGEVPICFYGTSILQGGCASRPGMAYPSLIGRALDIPHINLGFSGNAKCEPEVASLLAEIDPLAFVIDPLPNMAAHEVPERIPHLVKTIRNARPDAPIFLVEHVTYLDDHLIQARKQKVDDCNREMKQVFESLTSPSSDNMQGLYYIPGKDLYGSDGEASVDGTHATDLGFMRMAKVITPYLAKALSLKTL